MKQTFLCTNCSSQNEIGSRFCGTCGRQFHYDSTNCRVALYWPQQQAQPPSLYHQQQVYNGYEGQRKANPWALTLIALMLVLLLGGGVIYAINVSAETTPAKLQPLSENIKPQSTPSNITQSSAIVTQTTNKLATSQLEFGITSIYGSASPLDSDLVNSHSTSMSGLNPTTTYYFQVKPQDSSGNEPISMATTQQLQQPGFNLTTTANCGGGINPSHGSNRI